MSTVFSPSPVSLGSNTPDTAHASAGADGRGVYRLRRQFDGARGLAAMLLAAAVAALVVLADRLINTWADGHLFLAWVFLWVVVFAGIALFGGAARTLARRTLRSLDGWSQALAEARAEARLWELAKQDPRLRDELMQARQRDAQAADEAAVAIAPKQAEQVAYSQALAPMGLETGFTNPASARRLAQMTMSRRAGYLPYL